MEIKAWEGLLIMEFTGERYIPTEDGKIRLEHYHRYALVMDLIANKNVLDVASGEGYGSHLMSFSAESVTGVDISQEAINHASSKYQSKNLKFLKGSATGLDFPDNCFDVVVSFETLEHLLQQAEMISELRRVLKPEGCLVISSPNRPVYSEESGEHNEYHVRELDFAELNDLLKQQFGVVHYYGQKMLMGSVIQPLDAKGSSYDVWRDDGKGLYQGVPKISDAVYFVAICVKDGLVPEELKMSLMLPESLDLVKQYVGFAKWAKNQNKTIEDLTEKLSEFNRVREELEAANQRVDLILKSRSWRITALLRLVSRFLSKLSR